jgi:hypothetical protein
LRIGQHAHDDTLVNEAGQDHNDVRKLERAVL